MAHGHTRKVKTQGWECRREEETVEMLKSEFTFSKARLIRLGIGKDKDSGLNQVTSLALFL